MEQQYSDDLAALGDRLRRVVTGLDGSGRSAVVIDGRPGGELLHPGGVLHEIWSESAEPMRRGDRRDRGAGEVILEPPAGGIRVRWFTTAPESEGSGLKPHEFDEVFAAMGGGSAQVDTTKHPGMHTTKTIDVIAVMSGRVRLILEDGETVLGPGDVVIQRGTNHAWEAVGDELAVCLGILIDRDFASDKGETP